jgi:lipocalin
MYVETWVDSCDITKVKYPSVVKGAAAVAQGATGRYCEVIWIGPEYIAERGLTVLSREEAYAIVEKEGGYADF